jgi:hypothetical protein
MREAGVFVSAAAVSRNTDAFEEINMRVDEIRALG